MCVKMIEAQRFTRVACLASLLFVLGATASAQDIKYNYLRGTDFSKYKTYKWVKVSNAQYPNSILDDQIMQAIDSQLALKGLSKTEERPDLYVIYQVAVNQERQWNSYSTGGDYWGWGGWVAGAYVDYHNDDKTINIGTLNCDLYDVVIKNRFGAVKRARR